MASLAWRGEVGSNTFAFIFFAHWWQKKLIVDHVGVGAYRRWVVASGPPVWERLESQASQCNQDTRSKYVTATGVAEADLTGGVPTGIKKQLDSHK